jgi:hypothetical protein
MDNDLQNTTQKTQDKATCIPLKTGGERLRWSGKVPASQWGTRRVTLATNPVTSHEWGKDQIVITTNRTYPWSLVTQIFCNGEPKIMEATVKLSKRLLQLNS